jgi:hypothetical protein
MLCLFPPPFCKHMSACDSCHPSAGVRTRDPLVRLEISHCSPGKKKHKKRETCDTVAWAPDPLIHALLRRQLFFCQTRYIVSIGHVDVCSMVRRGHAHSGCCYLLSGCCPRAIRKCPRQCPPAPRKCPNASKVVFELGVSRHVLVVPLQCNTFPFTSRV